MGPSLYNGEPAMDTTNEYDWKTQLPYDSRLMIVNKITETLKKHLPFSGPEGINELRIIASRFEDKIFSGAVNQTDYLRKISIKMLTMENNRQNAAGSSSSLSIPAANNNLAFNLEPSLPNEEPAINPVDWRTQLSYDARPKIVNKIMETLQKHLPFSGPEGINELKRIASTFEDKIFSGAISQTDYLRKISMKMLTIETNWQKAGSSSSLSVPAANNSLSFDLEAFLMVNDNSEPSLPNKEPAINPVDWRTQLAPVSRQHNIDKLMETLKKHVPYSGQEGIDELRRIAISFEDLIFNTAVNQVDYLRKISLKMQTMEESD